MLYVQKEESVDFGKANGSVCAGAHLISLENKSIAILRYDHSLTIIKEWKNLPYGCDEQHNRMMKRIEIIINCIVAAAACSMYNVIVVVSTAIQYIQL